MAFLDRVLDEPSYGYRRGDALYVPTNAEIVREFFSRLSLLRSRKNWLPAFTWASNLALAIPLVVFLRFYFSWWLVAVGFVYSMVVLGSHGTIWLHRYSTHRAYRFRNGFFRALCRNLVIKIVPEETYVVSHHVHHRLSELPGDPYNSKAGFLYCFLADVNHQGVAKDLSEGDYDRLCGLLRHTGLRMNSFASYERWGSVAHPLSTVAHYALNWAVWYGVFYLIGGHALATALFGSAFVWALGVRTFNYAGHGSGKDLRREGVDFNTDDHAINQLWPGFVAGEWHSNHHLYPGGARAGFLRHQVDFAWYFIWSWAQVGAIASYHDFKADFLRDHYHPYLLQKSASTPRSRKSDSAERPHTQPSAASDSP
ncbi:MAG: fatty acid desaturase [Myxococcaceae bacterium]|nr:fatty acid desaturase [Myxococcaceae bacterium]